MVDRGLSGDIARRVTATCPIYQCSPDTNPDVSDALLLHARWKRFGWPAIPHDPKTLRSMEVVNAETSGHHEYILERARRDAEAANK